LLLDRRQTWWAVLTVAAGVCALVVFGVVLTRSPDGWRGGGRAGLLFGIGGGVLMLLAAMLTPLRYLPGLRWLGARQTWLRIHIWLGSLSGVLILCHSGFRLGGPFEQVLYALFFVTLLSGVVGVLIQQFLPGWLAQRVACEVPYDQLPHVYRQMVAEADVAAKEMRATAVPAETGRQLDQFYGTLVRPFLVEPERHRPYLLSPARLDEAFAKVRSLPGAAAVGERLDRLKTSCDERRQLAEQERLVFWTHGWLYIHVPASAALLVLAAAHVVMALYY
jgi:hypothetical protein